MTYEEMRAAALEYHTRGDAMGMYRFLRSCVADARNSREEGIARTLLAETLIIWRLGSRGAIEGELLRAKALLRGHPSDLANAVFTNLAWRAGENDTPEVQRLLAAYERLCCQHPGVTGVQRWRGRVSIWLGHLALARGDLENAIAHYQRSLTEYQQFETDPEFRGQLIRMSKLRLAQLALRSGGLAKARQYLDECEGSTISHLWETIRDCAEVDYALQTHLGERVQFWLRLARSWATPQSEAASILTLTQARVSYALGETEKARLLTLEARRLAAQHKQDHMLPEIREFFRVQESGVGAGKLTQGGFPSEQAPVPVAASGHLRAPGLRSRH